MNIENKKFKIAIFIDPSEKTPPSDKNALKFFISSGEKLGLDVDIVDINKPYLLNEYSAVFIRATTSLKNNRYALSVAAHKLGLVVIDSPNSIRICCDKIYQWKLFTKIKINYPKSMTLNKENYKNKNIIFPCVLKDPDSAFSKGVIKVSNYREFKLKINELLLITKEILVQPFMKTDHDWRIGIIDNQIIYACKYYMAKNHWQIYNWNSKYKKYIEGACEIINIVDIPRDVATLALQAAYEVGNGLYGVDIKVYEGISYIMEINDNPSIDHGIEDKISGEMIYSKIMQSFKQRICLNNVLNT